jgi:hypothetical protein
MRSLYN